MSLNPEAKKKEPVGDFIGLRFPYRGELTFIQLKVHFSPFVSVYQLAKVIIILSLYKELVAQQALSDTAMVVRLVRCRLLCGRLQERTIVHIGHSRLHQSMAVSVIHYITHISLSYSFYSHSNPIIFDDNII